MNGCWLILKNNFSPHKEGYECEILGKVCGKVHCEIYKGLTFEDYGIK
nr:MAG TPA: hypothetical protein [Caudoviricetes sp.]